jgi:Kef-type K+ transport system membrane component KefB
MTEPGFRRLQAVQGAESIHVVAHLVLQVALILIAAKLGAELFERVLHQPAVLGELLAGVVIGPFCLGSVNLPLVGQLFAPVVGPTGLAAIPVSSELWALAQLGAVVLLFYTGLETDFGLFVRYGSRAVVIALGGLIVPFALGDLATVWFGLAPHPLSPVALFVGTILAATSVGITARVLGDIHKLATPEGVSVLAAAVIDDVLGIVLLAIVVGMGQGADASPGALAVIAAKAFGFWLALLAVSVALSGWLSRLLLAFHTEGAVLVLALALAFLAGALAEGFGLAMIIGSYTIGLALSRTRLLEVIGEQVEAVYHFLVPIFFVVMGMLVNFGAMAPLLLFGLVVSVLAILGKTLGCGLPALAVGFNTVGATRIGLGMLPRGEVALIVAGVGISQGVIGPDIFGVSVLMTFVTTVLATLGLVPAFSRGGSGLRQPRPKPGR